MRKIVIAVFSVLLLGCNEQTEPGKEYQTAVPDGMGNKVPVTWSYRGSTVSRSLIDKVVDSANRRAKRDFCRAQYTICENYRPRGFSVRQETGSDEEHKDLKITVYFEAVDYRGREHTDYSFDYVFSDQVQ